MKRSADKEGTVTNQLTGTRLHAFLKALDQREEELRARIAEEKARTGVEGYSQLADLVGDDADHAFIKAELDIEASLMERQYGELNEIASARERIEAGTFGRCAECGGDIELARLRTHPAALRCSECQKLLENPGARGDIGVAQLAR